MKPWFMKKTIELSFKNILMIIFKRKIGVVFISPDSNCHAACSLLVSSDEFEIAEDGVIVTRGDIISRCYVARGKEKVV